MTFSFSKLVSLFASVVALATMGSQVALAQQNPRQNTTPPANSQPNNQSQSIEEFLGLSQDQIQKIRNILIERQQKIEGVLNKDQLDMIKQALNAGQSPDLAKLNLTAEQKSSIASISQNSSAAIRSVLTPEQLKKLESQMPPTQNRR